MKKLIVSCFVIGAVFNANAQNYWKKNAGKSAKIVFTHSKTNEKMVDKGTVKFEKMPQPRHPTCERGAGRDRARGCARGGATSRAARAVHARRRDCGY